MSNLDDMNPSDYENMMIFAGVRDDRYNVSFIF